MCGGRAHMEWAKKSYFDNTKVKQDYCSLIEYLISTNLGYMKQLASFIKQGTIQSLHVLLYNYDMNMKRKYRRDSVWDSSSNSIDGIWDVHYQFLVTCVLTLVVRRRRRRRRKKSWSNKLNKLMASSNVKINVNSLNK